MRNNLAAVVSNLIEAHVFRIKDDNIEFLLLKRAEGEYYSGLWQMVTGKIEEGEKAYLTALREIKEETGIKPFRLWAAPNVNEFYSVKDDSIVLVPVFAAEAAPESQVILSGEHAEFVWIGTEGAVPLLAWPGHRQSVRIISEYFTKERRFLDLAEIPLDM